MSLYLFIIVFCLLASAFFSASETAFSCANKLRLKSLEEADDARAARTLKLLDNFDSLISSILIGNNIVNILLTSLATLLFVEWLGEATGPSVCTIVTTIVVLVFGEVTPKSIAKEFPESFAMFATPILLLLVKILKPVNSLFNLWKKLIGKILSTPSDISTTEEELLMFVEETAQVGTITEDESDMIHNVLQFSDLKAVDILTPRVDVVAVDFKSSIEEIKEVFQSTGYSRLPVYEDTIDNIKGSIYCKDFYNKVLLGTNAVTDIVKPANAVVSSIGIKDLLQELKVSQNHLAVVISEYGSLLGIITLEDIIEELVGEIWDELDKAEPELVELGANEFEVSGSMSLRKLESELSLSFEGVDSTTVSGLIMYLLGRLPKIEDTVSYANLTLKVISMHQNRVDKLRVSVTS